MPNPNKQRFAGCLCQEISGMQMQRWGQPGGLHFLLRFYFFLARWIAYAVMTLRSCTLAHNLCVVGCDSVCIFIVQSHHAIPLLSLLDMLCYVGIEVQKIEGLGVIFCCCETQSQCELRKCSYLYIFGFCLTLVFCGLDKAGRLLCLNHETPITFKPTVTKEIWPFCFHILLNQVFKFKVNV